MNRLDVGLGMITTFFPTILVVFFLGRAFPLMQPSEVWHHDATQAAIQSYFRWSKLLMGLFAGLLLLTVFLTNRWRSWLLGGRGADLIFSGSIFCGYVMGSKLSHPSGP